MISFKNLIRAIENVGVATSYVVQYYSIGSLNAEELIQFLQARAIATEYLEQASNFSPKIRKALKKVQSSNYSEVVSKRYVQYYESLEVLHQRYLYQTLH